jgi:hypothetical protein
MVVRVVRRTGAFYDYTGPLQFGDGSFTAEQKGMPVEVVAGSATVTAVNGVQVTLDRALPAGDVAYLVAGDSWPSDGSMAADQAGAPGFAFARVMVDAGGNRMVPHHRAVDVSSDNRLMPQAEWTSTHTFASTCEAPIVSAILVHRAYPPPLARERSWELKDSVMGETERSL